MPIPICGYTTGSGIPGVPGVPENRLRVPVREIGAGDRRQSERGHRHCFDCSHATRKESATIPRGPGDDGHPQNR